MHEPIVVLAALDHLETRAQISTKLVSLVNRLNLAHVVFFSEFEVFFHVVERIFRHGQQKIPQIVGHSLRHDVLEHLQVFAQTFTFLFHLGLGSLSLLQLYVQLFELRLSAAELGYSLVVVHFFDLVVLELLLVKLLRVVAGRAAGFVNHLKALLTNTGLLVDHTEGPSVVVR